MRLDDLFVGLAMACLITNTAIIETESFTEDEGSFLRLGVAAPFLLWGGLYLVKASFLALCWKVFNVSPTFRKLWWFVSIYTFLTYWPIVLSQLWQCGDPLKVADPMACSAVLNSDNDLPQDAAIQGGMDALLHGSSDLLILALPLSFIRKLQMPRIHKLSVSGIFAIIIVDIVMGLLRNFAKLCLSIGYNVDVSDSIAIVMQDMEPAIAIIACALTAYGVLLPASRQRRREPPGLLERADNMDRAVINGPASPQMFNSDTVSAEEPEKTNIV